MVEGQRKDDVASWSQQSLGSDDGLDVATALQRAGDGEGRRLGGRVAVVGAGVAEHQDCQVHQVVSS